MITPAVKQTWTVMGVFFNVFGNGMAISYPSILLPALSSPSSEIPININVASWVASCIGPASIPSFVFSSYLMDRYGRKVAYIILTIPAVIGWLVIYFASNVPVLIIGRTLCGLAKGGTTSLAAVAIAEYSSPRNRGMFLNHKTTAVCLGNMMVHILGHYFEWRVVALIAIFPHVLSIIIMLTWPETPAWLASRKRFEESEKSFYWLRGKTNESTRELKELLRAQNDRAESSSKSYWTKCLEFFKKFTKKNFIRPLIITSFGTLLLESCGRHIFPAYAIQIIEKVTGNKSYTFYYTLAMDLLIASSLVISSIFVRIFKQRKLLLRSGFAALFVLICFCLDLFLSENEYISMEQNWIAILLFALYVVLVNLGCTPIPLALIGELFPLEHRGAGSSMAGCVLSIIMMAGMKITPYLLISLKTYGTFAVFGTAMGLSLFVLYFMLPETKDRTLQQIEDYFNLGNFKDAKVDSDSDGNDDDDIEDDSDNDKDDDSEVKLRMISH